MYKSSLLIRFVIGCPLTFSRDQKRFWLLYSTGAFLSDNASVTVRSVAKFVTGSLCIPATGLGKQIPVEFNYDCLPKNRPGVCKCLSTVSTCEIILNLPVSPFKVIETDFVLKIS